MAPSPCLRCGTPTPRGSYCEQHRPRRVNTYPKASRESRGYDHEWRKVRAFVLERDGHVCHWCGGKATEGDHLFEVNAYPQYRLDARYVVASCKPCNSRRGAEFRARRRAG